MSDDGAGDLARDSKFGHAVQYAVSLIGLTLAGVVSHVRLDTLPAWVLTVAAVTAGTVSGLVTSKVTRRG